MTVEAHETQVGHAAALEIIGRIEAVPTILDTVCSVTGMGFAAVARVTEEEWVAYAVEDRINFGLLPGGDLKLETTICNEIRQSRQAVIISDTQADPHYRDHHTPRLYSFRSYVSFPILLADGKMWGTLCAIDPEPRALDRPEVHNLFRMFAELIGFHFDMAGLLDRSEARLGAEVASGLQREQFIAVLGHDLRNPLASVQAGVTMLQKQPDRERATLILDRMQNSIDRMSNLVDDILDFARGRLGEGIALKFAETDVNSLVGQVTAELASNHMDRDISVVIEAPNPVMCDPERIAQLVSNLVGNALAHGAHDKPIKVAARMSDCSLRLSVTNGGEEISQEAQAKLFQPYERGGQSNVREGLGLGLYIASTIAKAHNGAIAVSSSPDETTFTFSMPLMPGQS